MDLFGSIVTRQYDLHVHVSNPYSLSSRYVVGNNLPTGTNVNGHSLREHLRIHETFIVDKK